MKDEKNASALARSLVKVSKGLGTPAVARLSRMEEPLGRCIGNALEVRESIEILRGEGPADTTEVTLTLAEEMLLLAGQSKSRPQARRAAQKALDSGEALTRFAQMVELQGGDPRAVDDPKKLPSTKLQLAVRAERGGTITAIDSLRLATVALELGAGRKRAEDTVDHAVGIELHVRVGDQVAPGDRLATLHARKKSNPLVDDAAQAFTVGRKRTQPPPLFLGRTIR